MGYFRKVHRTRAEILGAHLNLGIALADQFNLVDALAEFSKPCAWNSNSAQAHYNKGRVLLDFARDAEAIA
jgi:hypothetical protein